MEPENDYFTHVLLAKRLPYLARLRYPLPDPIIVKGNAPPNYIVIPTEFEETRPNTTI
jgi:hypothetical protein